MKVFDPTLNTLERSMDARLLRQNVLAGNVANADTPGFMPLDVDVEAAMAGPEAPASSPVLVQAEGARPGLDGNGVDLDRTLVSMAQNALQYAANARAASKKLAILRYVASDGAA